MSRFNNGYIKGDNGEDIDELEIPFECASKYYKNDNNAEESNTKKEKQIQILYETQTSHSIRRPPGGRHSLRTGALFQRFQPQERG